MKLELGLSWLVSSIFFPPKYSHAHCLLLFQKGTKAPQAAGKIHTDFEKGFIMAEVSIYSLHCIPSDMYSTMIGNEI